MTTFCHAPGQGRLYASPLVMSLPAAGHCGMGAVPVDTMSPLPYPISVWSPYRLLCRDCSISPQFFFRRNYSLCRCRFGVTLGGGRWVQGLPMPLSWSPLQTFFIYIISKQPYGVDIIIDFQIGSMETLEKISLLKSYGIEGWSQVLHLHSLTSHLALLNTIDHYSFQKCHRHLGQIEKIRKTLLSK